MNHTHLKSTKNNDQTSNNNDDEIIKTFEIQESQYFPELVTEDQVQLIEETNDSNSLLKNNINSEDKNKKDLFDLSLLEEKEKNNYFWYIVFGSLIAFTFIIAVKSRSIFSIVGLFFKNMFVGKNIKK